MGKRRRQKKPESLYLGCFSALSTAALFLLQFSAPIPTTFSRSAVSLFLVLILFFSRRGGQSGTHTCSSRDGGERASEGAHAYGGVRSATAPRPISGRGFLDGCHCLTRVTQLFFPFDLIFFFHFFLSPFFSLSPSSNVYRSGS